MAKACKRDLPPAVLALLEEFPTPPPAVMALLAESPTPAPKTARRQPKTASAPPPPANAAMCGRENEVHPAFRESDAPAAIPATDAPSATAPLTAASLISSPQPPNRQPKTVFAAAPPANAASVASVGRETKCSRLFGKRSASRRFGHRPAPGTPGRAPGNPGRNPGRRTGRLPGGISPRTPAGLLIPVLPAVSAGKAPRLPPFRPAPRRLPCQNPPVGRRQPKPLTPRWNTRRRISSSPHTRDRPHSPFPLPPVLPTLVPPNCPRRKLPPANRNFSYPSPPKVLIIAPLKPPSSST